MITQDRVSADMVGPRVGSKTKGTTHQLRLKELKDTRVRGQQQLPKRIVM
jgi:hypothetical protein